MPAVKLRKRVSPTNQFNKALQQVNGLYIHSSPPKGHYRLLADIEDISTLYVHTCPPRVLQMNPSVIRQWLRGGEIDQLEQVILEGQGHKLIGEYSPDPKVRGFLKIVPNYMTKIGSVNDAVNKGDLKRVKELLKVDESDSMMKNIALCKDLSGVGLLHKAVYRDHPDIVEYLVSNYPQTVHIKDRDGRTALHYCGACGDPEAMWRMLLNAGADPNVIDVKGRTAAHYMERPGDIELPEPKLPSGSLKRFTSGKDGLVVKPSNIRIWIHDRDLGRLQQVIWEGHGGKLRTETSNNPKVKRFLDGVPYIMNCIKDVHAAVINNDYEQYLKKTSDPIPIEILGSKDVNGLNPLHKAAGLGRRRIVEDILERNPKLVFSTDQDGKTPLHYAACLRDNGAMYNLLMDNGADEMAFDNNGKMASFYKSNPKEIATKVLEVIPEAPRTSVTFPPTWDWGFLQSSMVGSVGQLSSVMSNQMRTLEQNKREFEDYNRSCLRPPDDVFNAERRIPARQEVQPKRENVKEEPTRGVTKQNSFDRNERSNGNHNNNRNVDIWTNHSDKDDKNRSDNEDEEDEEEEPRNDLGGGYESDHNRNGKGYESDHDRNRKGYESDHERNGKGYDSDHNKNKGYESDHNRNGGYESDHNRNGRNNKAKEESSDEEAKRNNPRNAVVAGAAIAAGAAVAGGAAAALGAAGNAAKAAVPTVPAVPSPKKSKIKSREPSFEDREKSEREIGEERQRMLDEGLIKPNGDYEDDEENDYDYGNDRNIKKEDREVFDIIKSGDMEKLASMVLNGEGDKLLGKRSKNPEIQSFLDNVPIYMNKIKTVHKAARDGEIRELQAALDRRRFAIAKDSSNSLGVTPLHVATLFGRTPIVKYLGGRFPETLNAKDKNGRTPLHYAATIPDNGHYFNVLLNLGADRKVKDNFGHVPGYYLEHAGELAQDMLLKEFNAPAQIAREILSDKEFPVFGTEEGKYLVNALGEPLVRGLTEIANKRPREPIAFLANFLYEFVKKRKGVSSPVTDPSLHAREAEIAVNEGIPMSKPRENDDGTDAEDVNTGSDSPQTAFSAANRDEYGQSMLHFAAARAHGRGGLFQLIQESSINIGYRDELYRTARDVALQANIPDNINEIDKFVLSLAARGETEKLIELLLEGYDHLLDIEDDEDNSIVDVVTKKNQTKTLAFLKSIPNFEEKRERIHRAIRAGETKAVEEMVSESEGGGRLLVIGKNTTGRCSLHVAVLCQQEDITEFIAQKFPETLKLGDNLERTALHYAMGVEKVESLSKILIKCGAKRIIKDLKGRQPTYYFMNKSEILRLQEEEELLKI